MNVSEDSRSGDDDAKTKSEVGGATDNESAGAGPLPRENVTRIGRYKIIRQLGKGGFGYVYLASDPSLHRRIAIKVPRWDKPLKLDGLERFLREGKMLAQANHPSIVAVYDVGVTDDGIPFVVMEYVEGRALSELIRERPLKTDETIDLLLRIGEGLQQAHKRGLIHRDLKPSNVIIDDDQGIHLVDFGLALHEDLSPQDWGESRIVGTPAYMAPEQIRGENHLIDGQTDIWAFGVMMYRMLIGSLPFKGSGYRELSRSICYKNPRPMRQRDECIPRQLDRICFRCMQKLMEERYQSMADVLEELNEYVKEQAAVEPGLLDLAESQSVKALKEVSAQESVPGNSATQSGSAKTNSSRSDSDQEILTLVPKGLRSFDQNDRDFFLQLLPGPTDRHGVPESIRFWTSRLDMADQVDDIPIGLIYGRSGCGKSSFVRAGLIPRLSEYVVPVYVDCTTDRLADRIMERIHREINEVPLDGHLAEKMREIRQGAYLRTGDKLILILDQFEQWLNACDNYAENELTEALRQCESQRVQVLLLIRDEFWLSASQFLRCLGQRIEDRTNAMSLPLFDEQHAQHVLNAFGRAYGTLPADGKITRQQTKFLKRAVSSLANRGKVICVHLAVFAETAKSRQWNYADFKSVGGWEGIGREFITGIFNNPETPGYIKKHSSDAWNILRQLLPQSESELKGNAVERRELIKLSGLEDHASRFNELMHFMEFDANLISPVEDSEARDAEGPDAASTSVGKHERLYGLSHDFLVKPIRAWGTAKQNESKRGRAESKLAELANQWALTGDRRFLPSLLDFGKIALFADKSVKTKFNQYWKTARTRAIRLVGIGTVLAMGLVWIFMKTSQRDTIYQQQLLIAKYSGCQIREIDEYWPSVISQIASLEDDLHSKIRDDDVQVRFRANCALLFGHPEQEDIIDRIVGDIKDVPSNECHTFLLGIDQNSQDVTHALCGQFDNEPDPVVKSRIAIVLAHLGEPAKLKELMQSKIDPIGRTQAILELPKWHDDLGEFFLSLDYMPKTSDGDLLSGVCCAMALAGPRGMSEVDRDGIIGRLKDIYVGHPHGGAHYAAWYALDKWNVKHPLVNETNVENCQWKIKKIEIRPGRVYQIPMVQISKGTFVIGAGEDDDTFELIFDKFAPTSVDGIVEEDYWISVFEPPLDLFNEFVQTLEPDDPDFQALREDVDYKKSLAELKSLADWKQPRKPVGGVSWIHAIRFINWLNELGHEQKTYEFDEETKKLMINQVPGFHLATFEQFELAQRAGSDTSYFFGNDTQLLRIFCGFGVVNEPGLSGEYMPNAFGCFDLSSNESEWVEDFLILGPAALAIVKGANPTDGLPLFRSAYFGTFPVGTAISHGRSFRICLIEQP